MDPPILSEKKNFVFSSFPDPKKRPPRNAFSMICGKRRKTIEEEGLQPSSFVSPPFEETPPTLQKMASEDAALPVSSDNSDTVAGLIDASVKHEIETESSPSHRASKLAKMKEMILQIFQERQEIALEMIPLANQRRSRLLYDILVHPIHHALLLGTANFLVKIGRALHLSMTTLCVALLYLNRFYEYFKFENTERKFVAAACILLAWKYKEDIESERCNRKLLELPRIIYRVLWEHFRQEEEKCSPSPPSTSMEGSSIPLPASLSSYTSSSAWILQDNGVAFTKMKDRIKIYEIGLLRAIQYTIGPIPSPFPILQGYCKRFLIALTTGKCTYSQENMEKLRHRASLLLVDCYRTPLCLEYTVHELVVACIWRAAVLLNLFFEPLDHLSSGDSTEIFTTKQEDSTSPPRKSADAAFAAFEDVDNKMKRFLKSLKMVQPFDSWRIRLALHDLREMYETMSQLDKEDPHIFLNDPSLQ
ncbi:hypothetical protein IE077_000160 [Cardiosporidium cionae]|uniref:Cyclin N-terminal domain-containing protein n=1 Tax=Cardiosporidium cionae TaxID=476202 RepID=A0ABQ7J5E2_9APIC|nr:hypothetical protein IE077_000160 [Cardiosporidium cionae]|eukprot:KAF8819202.1 hypothetical protein IE077_000160 [Cardiosporidium cionae]